LHRIFFLYCRDRLAESEINKLLHGYSSRARPRQSSAHLLSLKVLTVRPDPGSSPLEETSLKVTVASRAENSAK
jgi:hypothetical protein